MNIINKNMLELNQIYIVLIILFIHWFADFVLQTDKQAKGKSNNYKDLLSHTISYSLVWLIIGILLNLTQVFVLKEWYLTLFVLITFVSHSITDYFTSKLNSKLWKNGDVHNFFVSIGFDQFLHYIQLFLTYYLVINI